MIFLLAITIAASASTAQGSCGPGSSLSFAKVSGFCPRSASARNLQLLYATSTRAPITAECYNRCKSNPACFGFIVYYETFACYKVDRPTAADRNLVYNPGVAYFSKVCLPVSGDCKDKAWTIQYTPGYELVGLRFTVLTNIGDKWGCAGACLNQGEKCASANYHSDSRTCTLSTHNKWTDTDSFIPTTQKETDYIENLCVKSNIKKFCWRDTIYNRTWSRSDLQYFNLTQEQCQKKCWDEKSVRCVGYSYTEGGFYSASTCKLNTDTKMLVAGPDLLPHLGTATRSQYSEIISCVDLQVSCDSDKMTVVLNSTKFLGRLYVQGRSDVCGVRGLGANTTVLEVPLPKTGESAKKQEAEDGGGGGTEKGEMKTGRNANVCDVHTALAIAEVNRTLITAVVVVQYHQLIQTVSDRVIRVSCLLVTGTEPSTPVTNNVTLNSTLSIQEPGPQTEVSGVGGTYNASLARARMSVVDPRTGNAAKDVQLGDPLQLRIEIDPPFNVSMVRVGHLIASSGSQEDSLLLLDWRGCPPDVTTFPALTPRSDNILAADFRAFRFPSSPVLMLSTVVTLCTRICQPTDCGNGVVSYGKKRKKRSGDSRTLPGIYQEMPLQLAIIVHSPGNSTLNSSNVLSATFGGGVTGGDLVLEDSDGGIRGVCLSFLTVALAALFWLLLQSILVALCCGVMARQKRKLAEERAADTISLSNDFHQAHTTPAIAHRQHHVTWAPDVQTPKKSLRLSTPVAT